MKGKMCSTENLAIAIWNELKPHLPPGVSCIVSNCMKHPGYMWSISGEVMDSVELFDGLLLYQLNYYNQL